VHPVRKPTWQQATALVSLSTCGAMTGLSFTHGTVADMTSPTSMPAHLVEFNKPARTESALAPTSASIGIGIGIGGRQHAAIGHRQCRQLLPSDGADQDTG